MLTMEQVSDSYYYDDLKSLSTADVRSVMTAKGKSFTVSQSSLLDALDILTPLTYWVTTPATGHAHIDISCIVTLAATLEIFEDDGNAAHFNVSAGADKTPINRNRVSTTESGLVIATGVTVTQATADVMLITRRLGGFIGGTYTSGSDLILAPSTEYLFMLTSDADNNEGSLILDWFEH